MIHRRTLNALEFRKFLEHLAGYAVSEAGRETCRTLEPLTTLDNVHAAAALIDEASAWVEASGAPSGGNGTDAVSFTMTPFPDCTPLLPLLRNREHILESDALSALRAMLAQAKKLAVSIRTHADTHPHLATVCAAPLPDMLAAALNRCLDDDGNIRDTASLRLGELRSEIRSIHQSCLHKVKEFAVQHNIAQYMQDNYMTLANDRYVLPIKTNFKGRIQGVLHDYSNTGETCYFEPMFLLTLNNRLQALKHEEHLEERKIMLMLTDLARTDAPQIQGAQRMLTDMDVILAKLKWADETDSVMVHMEEDAPLNLSKARHPILVFDPDMRRRNGPHPLDITLRRGDHALVITGGNAGGKTVCLKTLGLICVMTLAGVPVPVAKGSSLPWLPDVHAFIGDEQSLEDHASTFTAQIDALTASWEGISVRSLILLDEFGAGTDPAQGAALAQAVIDGLIDKSATVIAATHFPSLKTYALTRDGARAASVLFDPATKRPLFSIAYDQVGASLALDVAREHGLPEGVLERAEHYLLIDGQDTAAIMERLNRLALQREHELAHLHEEQAKAHEARMKARAKLDEERARLENDVRKLAGELMRSWQQGKVTAKQALKELSKIRANLSAVDPVHETAPSPSELSVGMEVLHTGLNKRVIIREIDRQGRVRIDMNGVAMWTEPEALRTCVPSSAPKPSGAILRTASDDMPHLRIDVRGHRAEEALAEIRRFLDHAILSGCDGVEILHGRGTGALRREIHSFLHNHPGIASYGVANEDGGGDGVTLVRFV